VQGHEGNAKDGIYRALRDQAKLVTIDFAKIKGSKIGEVAAKFDIILGATPAEG
jgi:protocatechuate 3,4-dioxygenase beta subunit